MLCWAVFEGRLFSSRDTADFSGKSVNKVSPWAILILQCHDKTSFSNSAAILDGKYKLNKIWPITIFNQLRSPKIQFDYKRRLQVVHLQKSTIYREIKQTSIEGTVKYNLFYIIWKNFIHWSSSFQIDLVNLASCIYDKESSILDKLTLYVKVKLNGLLSKNKVKLNGLSSLLWNLIFQVSNLWQG